MLAGILWGSWDAPLITTMLTTGKKTYDGSSALQAHEYFSSAEGAGLVCVLNS